MPLPAPPTTTATAPPRGSWKKQTWRGTSNGNQRGGSKDRLRRRIWLLEKYASDVPNFCRCYRCGILLSVTTLTVDRIIPGAHGGTYKRSNIRPACSTCNSSTGATVRAP